MLDSDAKSDARFISDTSILNLLEPGMRVTWQPEAFLRFCSTLSIGATQTSADRAFEAILWGCAQSGLTLLDETTIATVFGGIIDQTTLSVNQQHQVYNDTLERYGETPEQVLSRLTPSRRPLAAVQLVTQTAEKEEQQRKAAELSEASQRRRAETAERELEKVGKWRQRMLSDEERRVTKKRNANNSRKKKKKGK